MNDIAWSGRLLIWTGALVLLVESVAGRGFGALTVFAVLALSAGLIAFSLGLAGVGLPERTASPAADLPAAESRTEAGTPPEATVGRHDDVPAPLEPVDLGPAPEDLREQAAPPAEPVAQAVTAGPAAAPSAVPESPERRQVVRADRGARSVAAVDEPAIIGVHCFACGAPLRSTELAAICRSCGGPHHALCWIGAHFRCSRDGCGGHGPLAESPPVAEDSGQA